MSRLVTTDETRPANDAPATGSPRRRCTGDRFARLWACGLALLLIVTYPLWIAVFQQSYPRVAWIPLPASGSVVAAIESVLLVALMIGLTEIGISGRGKWSWWVVAGTLGTLILIDQHRLQPWAYQALLVSCGLAGLAWREARSWISALAISIYAYSALGKFDYQFVHTVGRDFVQAIASPIGGVSDSIAVKLAFVLPTFELLVAIALMIPTTRRLGGWGAVAMHLSLIGLLGPWALDHSWGVLVWNAMLAGQAWALFASDHSDLETTSRATAMQNAMVSFTVRVLFLMALVAPMGERFGYWDHWTSWALYSPHNSRIEIQVHRSAAERLPEQLADYLVESDETVGWQDLDLESFSLEQRWVPIYPQARYQLDVISAIATRHQLGNAIRVQYKSMSNRWTGKREVVFAIGIDEMTKLRKRSEIP